jgi:hypothetical protein
MNNNAAVYNLGSDGWSNIELNAGRFELETDQVKNHGSQTFLLDCEKEGGGHITGHWIRENYGIKFSYFTPNKDTDYEVFLEDNASFRYKQIIK